MRLCRRHGWVRARLPAERRVEYEPISGGGAVGTPPLPRPRRAGRAPRAIGRASEWRIQGRGGHDQDHDCAGGTRQLALGCRLFAPGEADEQGERGPRSAPRGAPPAGECFGDVPRQANTEHAAVPVASRAGAQAPGAGHAGALLPRPELNGNAAPFPAPSCASVAAPGAGAGPAAPSSDDGPAAQLLPPTNFSASTPEPEPVMAPAESRHTASRAPEPLRDDPVAELSPGTVSAAPLLHPQRQRELMHPQRQREWPPPLPIEQAVAPA